ncbi:related to RAV1 - similarity to Drosophila DmX gene [Cephalotrichum gorgonifer]|uniref:Related to RAV1 - similarity to Drosophila DmX protein n=1 Tax=Cephalotrichum gorgonifer TaxID=2041049 RepID=A0AAE8STD6_9PEZI|nr:related to RAV1 - similarity to Drosophila DmX gene [Cephalotrichum gorgonifer]
MPSPLLYPALAPHDGRSGSEVSSHASEAYYTTNDIHIVHAIVAAAQESLNQLPEADRLPTNELFQAYDAVLPAYGIDPEDDQHLSRLVFRIGGERGNGTLLEKFRAVLSRMGIEVVFDDTGPVPHELALPHGDGTHPPPLRPLELRSARRISDTELSNTTRQSYPASQARSHSYSGSSEVTAEAADAAGLISNSPRPRSPYADHIIQQSPHLVPLDRAKSDTPSDPSLESPPTEGSGREQLDTVVAEIPEDFIPQDVHGVSDDEDRMEERAAHLEEHRLASFGVKLFRVWGELAKEAEMRMPPESSEYADAPYDKIETVFTQWKAFMEWKRNAAEEISKKEAHLRRCDRLATRAHEIYLLTTALTLWHGYAANKEERTTVARRHILRLRHFDSWKELALSEERAVRTFVQSQYFPRWVDQHMTLSRREEIAAQVHRNNLLSTTFMTWQLGAFEQSVQSRGRRSVRESTFGRWLQTASLLDKPDIHARSHYHQRTLARATQEWLDHASHLRSQDANSLSRLRETTISDAFRLWATPSRLEQVNNRVHEVNVLSRTFGVWHLEAQVVAFQRQRNHQLLSETFTSWMTFQKVETFQLQRERRLKETTFQLFIRRSEELATKAKPDHALEAAHFASRASSAALFQTWSLTTADVIATESATLNSTCEVTKIDLFNNWYGAALQDAELDRWARRGYSFLAIQGNFDSWKVWAKREKERKLRATYTKARHAANMHLVRGCWRAWETDCASATVLQGAAEDGCRSRDRDLLATAVERWIWSANHDTNSDRRSQLLVIEGLFGEWVDAAADYVNGESETSTLWIERLAGSCWNRWNIAYQWMEGQAYNADNAAQRRHKEAATRIFLQWVENAAPDRLVMPDGTARGLRDLGQSDIAWGGGAGRHRYTPARVQSWSRSNLLDYNIGASSRHSDNQDDELDSIVGGMNTPTRWTGLARPLVGLSSTTPSGPLPTPYERELRNRYPIHAGSIRRGQQDADTHDSGAYITGNAFTILTRPQTVVQTIYGDTDDRLEAITIDEESGRIATCTRTEVRLYRPCTENPKASLKWTLEATLAVAGDGPTTSTPTLSWGASQDLLIGTDELVLYSVRDTPDRVWSKRVPNPVFAAALSYDSTYIASVGQNDGAVQVWRRLAFGSDETHFDLSYLHHPQPVTDIRWRKPFHVDQTIENVLYTFCADQIIRVWAGSDSHGSHQLQLCGRINVATSIQEDFVKGMTPDDLLGRWVAMVDGRDFSVAVEKAVQLQNGTSDKENLPIDHLISFATNHPEIFLVFNGDGVMSAWAVENLFPRAHGLPRTEVLNVAYVKSREFELPDLRPFEAEGPRHVQIQSYCDRSSGQLMVFFELLDGRVEVYSANVVDLFSPTAQRPRLSLQAVWSGHSAPITKVVRNYSGSAIVSRTADGESLVWKHDSSGPLARQFARQSLIPVRGHIHRICVLRKGRFVVLLRHANISLWDCRGPSAVLLDSQEYTIPGKPLCLLILPRQKANENLVAHIATVTSTQQGIVWEVILPRYSRGRQARASIELRLKGGKHQMTRSAVGSVREFCRFELDDAEGLAYVLPVDPAGSTPVVAGFLDVFARDVAISYTSSGRVDFWTARLDSANTGVDWLATSSTETGVVEPALVSGSTLKKAALVNKGRSQFTIWDIGGCRLEYSQEFEAENTIKDLDWTSTPDSQSILAVGYQSRVVLLCQMRFDYLNKGPAWAPIREISIDGLTSHPIGDSTWLGDGHLVVGAGNQIFTFSREFDMSSSLITKLKLPQGKGGTWDMFETVRRLNGPLPVFHPQFLSQCILSGKSLLVRHILASLNKATKFSGDEDPIDNYLDMDLEEFYGAKTDHISQSRGNLGSYLDGGDPSESHEEAFSEEMAASLNERLTRVNLRQLSGQEQIQLADIVECLGMVEKHRRSLDENGARFLLFFRQAMLRRGRAGEFQISWRDINWAFHSDSQDILTDFVSRQYNGTLLWENAKESGVFSWLSDASAVRSQFERVARSEYTKGDAKDPINCSLFYFALKQRTVLRNLWRLAAWHPEQRATYKLLSNDFDDPRWKKTALKNAYALLSKRRYQYAAAFFLLGDSLQDAVNVCVHHLDDLQLAVAIARVYEGDEGPVLRRLLEEEVLTHAAQEGNRWLASWAFWILKRKDVAVRALITPVYNLLDTPRTPEIKSQLFLTDDPALVVLYSQLRQQTLQTLRGASKVTPYAEWQFVLHSARIYDRMGCDLLGLDLVRNWEFLHPDIGHNVQHMGGIGSLQLSKRRASTVVADIPFPSMQTGTGGMGQPAANHPTGFNQPTLVQEPDADSFLDSFGF